ncbi:MULTISPECIES: polysaccharide pyruvyl transferase family protein [Cyanophyceae]|uniref:Polysaccharide pyruvyl transferase family protein n=1 Tax=Leptolyngbya subtilissima DQ-A4 TaxID=2933933 RepID=A0ABV0JYY7_9CYAN|nr:polysaccharide pyruvyl transferase family protein [Nodosilinea sp. FACHB-141]MBD2112386.1 polysaccharide pyruvyl transferase family protein [Nodosilinea sp. FACHB-141]
MITEIRGVQFENKGAELMLYAVVQQLKEWDENNIVAMRVKIGSYSQRSQVGVHQLLWSDKKIPILGSSANLALNLIPKNTKDRLGLITYPQINAVLDASGFNYSDQWGLEKTAAMLELAERCKKAGKKVVLLPQAFGPFKNREIRDKFSKILSLSDLVFARDDISYKYLIDLAEDNSKIKLGPDFTNLLTGITPKYIPENIQNTICIIPNVRMTDKTSKDVSNSYFHFLESSIKGVQSKGFEPLIVVHENCDIGLAEALKDKFGNSVELIIEENPLRLKGLIGKSYAVIGSRFHGLINSLSQGVPCIATGWSHKYRMLMKDYNCPECLLEDIGSEEKILQKIDIITSLENRDSLRNKIQEASIIQKKAAVSMWDEVRKVLY